MSGFFAQLAGFSFLISANTRQASAMELPVDRFERGIRDLRISVTDRCNFRCRYCMPIESFGADHEFLPREELLSFEELTRLTRLLMPLGVRKIRLTGGEPLMRRGLEDLVAMLAAIDGVDDIAMTTNGVLLAHHAEALALAGLSRVTVSLDALDPEIFSKMNGVSAKVDRVIAGIDSALTFGLPVKVNSVIQRGVNESQILPLARWAAEREIDLRFIEFMDVGETNGWKLDQVVSASEILEILQSEFSLNAREPAYRGEVARYWKHAKDRSEIGIISSVTKPFCSDCQRLRVSADGKIFTCLFSNNGHDLRGLLRGGLDDDAIRAAAAAIWKIRDDRYSEERGSLTRQKAEMSYLGG